MGKGVAVCHGGSHDRPVKSRHSLYSKLTRRVFSVDCHLMKWAVQFFSAVLATVCSGAVLAADLPGSRDLEVLPRFPASHIVAFKEAPDV